MNTEIRACTLLHALLCGHLFGVCFVCVSDCVSCPGEIRGKGDVMFDDVIAYVQGVQISGRGFSEPALHSCPALSVCPAPALYPPVPALPVCEL